MEHACRNSNWCSLQRIKTSPKECFMLDTFQQVIKDQIGRQLKRDSFFGKECHGGYTVEKIDFVKESLPHFENQQSSRGQYYPLLTFHGTDNPNTVKSIVKHGYFLPEELHPLQGYTFKIKNGKYYGEGIYTSTSFDMASWFSFFDQNCRIQLIVNFVQLGKVSYVEHDSNEGIQYASVQEEYVDGSHTRMTFDLTTIVSASGKYVIPLAVVTLKPNWNVGSIKTFLHIKSGPLKNLLIDLEKRETEKDEAIELVRFCQDWHMVDLSSVQTFLSKKNRVKKSKRHSIMIPLSLVQQEEYAKQQIQYFVGSIPSEGKTMYMYGQFENHVVVAAEHGTEQLQSALSKLSLNKSDSVDFFMKSLEKALDDMTNVNIVDNNEMEQVLYVFITNLSFLQNDCNISLEKVVKKYAVLMKSRQIMVKIVNCCQKTTLLSKETIQSLLQSFKNPLQTIQRYESNLVYSIQNNWDQVVDTLLEEEAVTEKDEANKCFVPFPFGIVGEGFIMDLSTNPIWDGMFSEDRLIYKGFSVLPCLGYRDKIFRVKYKTRNDIVTFLLNEKNDATSKAKIGKQYQNVTKHFCTFVIQILCRFRTFVIKSHRRALLFKDTIALLCKCVINELVEIQQHPELMTWCDLMHMKNSAAQIQKLASDINGFCEGALFAKDEWFAQLMHLKFSKQIINRVSNKKMAMEPLSLDSWKLLKGWKMTIRISSSSQVEPWLLIVDDICNDTGTAFNSFASVNENNSFVILPETETDKKPSLDLLQYYAFVFTQNPFLSITSQRFALGTIAWVRSLEMFFRHDDPRKNDKFIASKFNQSDVDYQSDWDRCWNLTLRIQKQFQQDAYAFLMVEKVSKELMVEKYMKHVTESAGVLSICQMLAALTISHPLITSFVCDNDRFVPFSFALMAECVMRNCRVYLKENSFDINQVIRTVFAMNCDKHAMDIENKEYIQQCVSRTSAFYRRRFTNCSPFALVSALGVVRLLHQNMNKDQIQKAFVHKEITMSLFLQTFVGQNTQKCTGHEVQLALFLQGVRFHKSKMRDAVCFNNPKEIIRQSFQEQVLLLNHELRSQGLKQNKCEQRLFKRQQEALTYSMNHQRVKLFNYVEVDALNLTKTDQEKVILQPQSGLLVHHCCYVDCPQFLHNFESEKDRLFNKKHPRHPPRRQGLLHHLRHNHLNDNYVSNFHVQAKQCARDCKHNFKEFCKLMDDSFANDKRYGRLEHRNVFLEDAFAKFVS